MANIKDIFKILVVIQLICCVFASYGHPDAETIDFGLDPSRDQVIIEAAIRRGMDGDAVTELLRTKQPVVKTVSSPSGLTKTTTYKLEDDGSISSKTVTQSRKSYTYNSDSIPDSLPIDDLRNSPSGTVTRTFTDENGHKVTQTISVDKPKPSTVPDADDFTGDWFNKPFPRWNHHNEEPSTPLHGSVTRTFTGPNGERRTVQSWSSNPDLNDPVSFPKYPPSNNYHRTVTRTFIGPNGEKRVVQTTSSDPDASDFLPPKQPTFPSINTDSWPGFDFSAASQPWGSPNTNSEDSDDWTVVEGNSDVETSTKKKFETWTPKSWNWPEFPTFPTTTTAKPKIFIQSEIPTPNPLPNLDDFLKSQYGPSTTSKTQTPSTTVKATTTSHRTPTNTPKSLITTTTKNPIRINLEDLPVTQVFHNGKPADEAILKNLPPHLKPKNPDFFNNENVLKIENKHPIEEDVEVFSPQEKTSITTIKKTHLGPERPTIKDLDPHMQEILKNAGISPEDITNIDGDTITKTRTEPDGRKITTTYKVQTVPVHNAPREITPVVHRTPVTANTHKEITPKVSTYIPYKPLDIPQIPPLTPLSHKFSPISEFLAKLGLSKSDIASQHGRVTKTFIDDDGQVLTATFVLSSPMNKISLPELKDKPIK